MTDFCRRSKSKVTEEITELGSTSKKIDRKVETAVQDKKKMGYFNHGWNYLETLCDYSFLESSFPCLSVMQNYLTDCWNYLRAVT